ncbi:hypothetical protein ACROYT_G015987 [Oculina patagonica]
MMLQGKFNRWKPSPEEIQEARKRHLQEYCMTHSFNKRPTKEDRQYIAVDDENKIIYCALQKVASKTWIEVLERLGGMEFNPWRWEVFPRFGEYSEKEKSLRLKTRMLPIPESFCITSLNPEAVVQLFTGVFSSGRYKKVHVQER